MMIYGLVFDGLTSFEPSFFTASYGKTTGPVAFFDCRLLQASDIETF